MFIQVRLLKGFQEPLWYEVPATWDTTYLLGSLVQVPLKNKISAAWVERVVYEKPQTSFALKQAHQQEPFPHDNYYLPFVKQLAAYYQVPELFFLKRIRQFLGQQEKDDEVIEQHDWAEPFKKNITLTDEQQAVLDALSPAGDCYKPVLLQGVTGSGKTEVYKALIEKTIAAGKSVLLLLPEVTLAVQFMHLLKDQLDQRITIIGFHSATSVKEKRLLWQSLLAEKPLLIIGVHLPILLPLPSLGLIIVDEEHEVGYQEKKHPKINTKEAALLRAQLHAIPIVLGSATPSIATVHLSKTRNWDVFHLKKRFAGAFPKVRVVNLRHQERRRNFWISKELENALYDRLAKKEQSIIFLNRRGYSFFVQCKACSFIFSCARCSVSLTLHDNQYLTCHYCNFSMIQPQQCSACKAPEKDFLKKGIGTQQVVTVLSKLFPHARIERADLDTTLNKKKWQTIVTEFKQGSIDILVGTQTITKGYHFPNVTLVGILWADLNLHFPMYNAAEVTLQQLIQVAGRAGRQRTESMVIVQTMLEHPIFAYLNEQEYANFYEYELEKRALVGYPPCVRLAEIEIKSNDERTVQEEAELLFEQLYTAMMQQGYKITLLGPAKPPVYKLQDVHIRKIYLKGARVRELGALYACINHEAYKSSLFYTPNPLN